MGLTHCSVFGNIESKKGDKVKVEMHHGPIFTLYDYVSILLEKRLRDKTAEINTFDIAREVLDLHKRKLVQTVMLCESVHKSMDNKKLAPFIPLDMTFGNLYEFIVEYGEYFSPQHRAELKNYFSHYQDNDQNNRLNMFKPIFTMYDIKFVQKWGVYYMSFESVYRSKQGVREIEKVAGFIGSLVIKNEYEAQRDETTESLSEYIKYHGAYTNTDSFNNYGLDERRDYKNFVWTYMNNIFKTYSFNSSILNTLTESRIQSLQKQYDNKVPVVQDYLKALRAARLEKYDEKNTYYRQFLGKPNNSDDIVYVINKDIDDEGYTEITDLSEPPNPKQNYYTKIVDEEDDGAVRFVALGRIVAWYRVDPDTGEVVKIADNFYRINTIPIDKINKTSTPLTYNYFILQQHISEVIEEYPTKYYLRFIGKTFTPFYLRSLPNYSIIYYDPQYLSTTEMYYFFKSYDKARRQVVLDYIKGFDSKQP
ncbi:MAG: hypothetical protein K2N99_00535, partial [Malacoplasma sp.]|nr:hypothetical protein [Malacoplasma sp.]